MYFPHFVTTSLILLKWCIYYLILYEAKLKVPNCGYSQCVYYISTGRYMNSTGNSYYNKPVQVLLEENIAHRRGPKANIAIGFAPCYISFSTVTL